MKLLRLATVISALVVAANLYAADRCGQSARHSQGFGHSYDNDRDKRRRFHEIFAVVPDTTWGTNLIGRIWTQDKKLFSTEIIEKLEYVPWVQTNRLQANFNCLIRFPDTFAKVGKKLVKTEHWFPAKIYAVELYDYSAAVTSVGTSVDKIQFRRVTDNPQDILAMPVYREGIRWPGQEMATMMLPGKPLGYNGLVLLVVLGLEQNEPTIPDAAFDLYFDAFTIAYREEK